MTQKIYTIIIDEIPIGFFMEEKDRDDAFDRYIGFDKSAFKGVRNL